MRNEDKTKSSLKIELENMTIKTMDCYWLGRLGSILYQRALLRLFIPNGDVVFPLCIK